VFLVLQGFPGVTGLSPYQNNPNGPGSAAVRAYWQTIRTFGVDVDEVQTVTTRADRGQNLGGGFRLRYKGSTTVQIPHNASPLQVLLLCAAAVAVSLPDVVTNAVAVTCINSPRFLQPPQLHWL
jgi:hypothetical protein